MERITFTDFAPAPLRATPSLPLAKETEAATETAVIVAVLVLLRLAVCAEPASALRRSALTWLLIWLSAMEMPMAIPAENLSPTAKAMVAPTAVALTVELSVAVRIRPPFLERSGGGSPPPARAGVLLIAPCTVVAISLSAKAPAPDAAAAVPWPLFDTASAPAKATTVITGVEVAVT